MPNLRACVLLLAILVNTLVNGDVHSSYRVLTDLSAFESNKMHENLLTKIDVGPHRIRYTLGTECDGKTFTMSRDGMKFPAPKDVQFEIEYNGAKLKCVDILVKQFRNMGHAYVVSGGIGDKRILIKVEGSYTPRFDYEAKFFW